LVSRRPRLTAGPVCRATLAVLAFAAGGQGPVSASTRCLKLTRFLQKPLCLLPERLYPRRFDSLLRIQNESAGATASEDRLSPKAKHCPSERQAKAMAQRLTHPINGQLPRLGQCGAEISLEKEFLFCYNMRHPAFVQVVDGVDNLWIKKF